MKLRIAAAAIVVATMALMLIPGSVARASEDATGFWYIPFSGTVNSYCYVDFTMTGTTFSGYKDCTGTYKGMSTGTLNPSTGATTGTFDAGGISVSWIGTTSGDSWTGSCDSGCGGSGAFNGSRLPSQFSSPSPGGATVATTVDTGSPDFTSVTLPSGALATDTTVTASVHALPSSPPLPLGTFSVAKAYAFMPSPVTFLDTPCDPGNSSAEGTGGARAVFTYDPGQMPAGSSPADLRIYVMNGSAWDLVGGFPVAPNTIVVHVCHFSTYTLFGPSNLSADSDGDGVTNGAEVAAGTDPFRAPAPITLGGVDMQPDMDATGSAAPVSSSRDSRHPIVLVGVSATLALLVALTGAGLAARRRKLG